MPNIGPVELIIILVIALIVIGPGRLPDVGAALGKSIREFRKASSDISDAARVETSPTPPAQAGTPVTPNTLSGETEPNTLSPAPPAPPPPSAPVVAPPPAPVVAPPPADEDSGARPPA